LYISILFSEQSSWQPKLDGLAFDSIDEELSIWLERSLEESEVLELVKCMNKDKAPGQDSFIMAFFQTCWDVIKDAMRVFHEFHASSKFEKSFNALIPKEPGAVAVKDFRPISLVTGVYKIIAKIISTRLKRVVEKIISKR
jgi:hypothetical protein